MGRGREHEVVAVKIRGDFLLSWVFSFPFDPALRPKGNDMTFIFSYSILLALFGSWKFRTIGEILLLVQPSDLPQKAFL